MGKDNPGKLVAPIDMVVERPTDEELAKIGFKRVEMYGCDVCHSFTTSDFEEAKRHNAIPIRGLDLPVGLLLRVTSIASVSRWMDVVIGISLSRTHERVYDLVSVSDRDVASPGLFFLTSSELIARFGSNRGVLSYSRFTPLDYANFLEIYHQSLDNLKTRYAIPEFVRICPDLEALSAMNFA